jgi:hypothetical protein
MKWRAFIRRRLFTVAALGEGALNSPSPLAKLYAIAM